MGHEGEFFFSALPLSDVNARPDVTEELAIRGKARCSNIQNPAIFTVTPSQVILHCKRLPGVEGIFVNVKTTVEFFSVNAFCPAIAELLLQAAAGKVEPPLIEEGAKLVWARHPDHHRSCVGHGTKTSLAFPKLFLCMFAECDVPRQSPREIRLHIF